ncbi:putative FAD-linked oxidoreductase [Halenospora varia]|nr:putative FAD-linked oxidoreductase [Halenospora varia]
MASTTDRDLLIETIGAKNVFIRGFGFYENEVVQYATSSYPSDRTSPALIIKPKNREDIAATLEYAKNQGIAVAIRTGGHQYSGASSCTAPNIQLDLSETFQGPDDRTLLRKRGFLRTSVSWSLNEFSAYLAKNKIFVPHGQCIAVHLGGHVQSGGYGQLGRSFGLFGDHVTELEIVDHEGTPRTISRNNDPDLFKAILGGSPGNFCVVTHFTIKIYRDEDYEGSTGTKCMYLYTPETLERLLDIVVKMSDEKDKPMPRNYDLCVSVVSSGNNFLAHFPSKGKQLRDICNGDDDQDDIDKNLPTWPRLIFAWAQWVKLSPEDTYNPTWFNELKKDALPTSINLELAPTAMSKMTSKWWILDAVREYPMPYVKSTRVSDKKDLAESGWAKWITGRIEEVVAPSNNGLFICAQIQPFGGEESMTRKNADNGTSFSWRESTVCATLDCFHLPEKKAEALAWHKENETKVFGPKGNFSSKDMRVLWGSFGEYDFSKVWSAYHEDEAKYQFLRDQRRKHDPDGVFTPNTFCVPAAPGNKLPVRK